jgi:hypothetical protein
MCRACGALHVFSPQVNVPALQHVTAVSIARSTARTSS